MVLQNTQESNAGISNVKLACNEVCVINKTIYECAARLVGWFVVLRPSQPIKVMFIMVV